MNELCQPCLLSHRNVASIARCTVDCDWPVCSFHELSAAACGFYPRRHGLPESMTPAEAVEIYKELHGETRQ